MTESLYQWYRDIRNLINKAEKCEVKGATERVLVSDWIATKEILENGDPRLKERYERWLKNQQSLSPEQIDFICYQIGDWYLEWKDRLVIDLKQGTHRLGFAKEQLKTLICGD